MTESLEPRKISLATLGAALGQGLADYRAMLLPCLVYSLVFSLAGLMLFLILEAAKVAPISLSLAGGFLLIGPALLAGFFGLAAARDAGRPAQLRDILAGFRQAPAGLWGLTLICGLMFLIWMTDAATVYAFVVGQYPVGFGELLPPVESVRRFVLFSSLMGLALALILFAASAFSVPLLIDRDPGIVAAVVASARAVWRNLGVMLAWALILAVLVMGAAWFLPLLPLTLPVCALAGRRLYQQVFPP